jgi:putative NADH-flavin reductase
MQVAVLGAAGRTSRLPVREAHAGGHEERALARDTSKLPDGLQAGQGDAAGATAVGRLLEHADALISALGPVEGDRRR